MMGAGFLSPSLPFPRAQIGLARCTIRAMVTKTSVSEAHTLKSSGWKHVDVRTPGEFREGRPESSANVAWMFRGTSGMVRNEAFLDEMKELHSPDDQLLISCASGKRSAAASAALEEAGFQNIRDVEGGFAAWTEAGLPVEKGVVGGASSSS